MKWIRPSAWALILSALIFLFGFAWDHLLKGPFTPFTVMIGLFGDILFLISLPGIQQSQPQTGRPGQIGLILMGMFIPTVILEKKGKLSDAEYSYV